MCHSLRLASPRRVLKTRSILSCRLSNMAPPESLTGRKIIRASPQPALETAKCAESEIAGHASRSAASPVAADDQIDAPTVADLDEPVEVSVTIRLGAARGK